MSKTFSRWSMLGSGLLFGVYCLNVAAGKIALMVDRKPPLSLGDVGEFVVLFAAVVCFVTTVLIRESQLEHTE